MKDLKRLRTLGRSSAYYYYKHYCCPISCADPSPQPLYATAGELVKCDGRCGLESCKAHFQSQEDLANHIRLTRKPQCRHVSVLL